MDKKIAGYRTSGYRIETEIFEGPLDLLLELIQRMELDITKVALSKVTDQYLEYLHHMQELDAAQVSAFLVIAAKLLQIKSESLLPRPIVRENDEEDPGEALAQQLRLYRTFKKAAEWLGRREDEHLRTYLRISSTPKIQTKPTPGEISLDDLLNAARSVFFENPDIPLLSEVITIPKITIREKIQSILSNLHHNSALTFRALITQNPTRIDIVITFLAILELIKRHIIRAQQAGLFADIDLQLIEEWYPPEDFELEFEE